MEKKEHTVLLVDDHPLIINAYRDAFNYLEKHDGTISFKLDDADSCDSAFAKINYYASNNHALDIVFLDIQLPTSKDGPIISGEDLGLNIRKFLPDTKIIISTTFNENYRVHSLFKNLNPDGFLIKNDLTPKDLVAAIQAVINDPPYYSQTVIKLLRNEVTSDFLLDDVDRRLLYELSIGAMMKDIPNILKLSLAGIEKRKRHLKQIFDAEGPSDKELLIKAKEKGFI